ncbi:MAG: tRNA pseudouridine(13) synthase TruD [Gammaproteobacteria bacterium]|nr:tRNA pseudouridine(13) synthase TruD [Gammaproteobacteria bacterium]
MILPFPWGEPSASALMKARCEDFVVTEVLGFEPGGEGEHLFLWVEKRGLNTSDMARAIAADNDLDYRQVSWSGLKDRHALTRQWLSVHLPGSGIAGLRADGEGYRILRQQRHRSKLRPGTHRANRFRVCLREVSGFDSRVGAQIERIGQQGFANYFGAQRFGRDDNVAQALESLGRRRLSRQRRGLLISALRSDLFNRILARRIEMDCWQAPLEGDVFMLRGSRSVFREPLDDSLRQRFATGDISSCGSLFGRGESMLGGQAAAIEAQVLADNPLAVERLEEVGARRELRPLRAFAGALDFEFDAAGAMLTLELELPAGCYLTTLLEHFLILRQP